MRVTYTNEDGLKEIRDVPNNLSLSEYYMGILIGPPDLTVLDLNKTKILQLNHALVDAGFIQWPNLSGQRHKLVEIIAQVTTDSNERRKLKLSILTIYQQAYYPVVEEIM